MVLRLETNDNESPIAGKMLGRPIHLDFGAPGLLDTCAHWLQACEKNHPKCHRYAPSFLPKRVIDVGNDSIRLVEVDTLQENKYATISRNRGRWMRETMTVTESIGRFKQGIQLDELEPTVRDVITLIRRLCIRYLWIDNLCIVWDSSEGISLQTKKISEYYTNAALNIVAGHQSSSISMFTPRDAPRFSPVCINRSESMFAGWLGTDSYCDPRGLNVGSYPDGWKYQSRLHTNTESMQEMPFARRNLVFQADEDSLITSQLYMQCQEEVRWENGRTRSGSSGIFADWYKLVEEYSRRRFVALITRLSNFARIAKYYSHTVQGRCGDHIAGLWYGDLFRGLLWRAEDGEHTRITRKTRKRVTWSWASCPGAVKHVWPSNAIVCAEVLDSSIETYNIDNPCDANYDAYIVMRSSLAKFKLVNENLTAWTDDVEVNVQTEDEPPIGIKIRYFIDDFDNLDIGAIDLFSLKITRRVALLLTRANDHWDYNKRAYDTMRRVGLMIVAKPDTQKWASVVNQCDVKLV